MRKCSICCLWDLQLWPAEELLNPAKMSSMMEAELDDLGESLNQSIFICIAPNHNKVISRLFTHRAGSKPNSRDPTRNKTNDDKTGRIHRWFASWLTRGEKKLSILRNEDHPLFLGPDYWCHAAPQKDLEALLFLLQWEFHNEHCYWLLSILDCMIDVDVGALLSSCPAWVCSFLAVCWLSLCLGHIQFPFLGINKEPLILSYLYCIMLSALLYLKRVINDYITGCYCVIGCCSICRFQSTDHSLYRRNRRNICDVTHWFVDCCSEANSF